MSSLMVYYGLMVNDRIVPVEKKVMAILNPGHIGPAWFQNMDEDGTEMDLVNFMCSARMSWLEHVLELPTSWWRKRSNSIPLLAEIKTLVQAHKDQERDRRAPRETEAALVLNVRDKILMVQNLPHLVRLVLPQVRPGIPRPHWC